MKEVETYHDGWEEREDNLALMAGEMDHGLTRVERTELISRNLDRTPEDYSD